MSTIVRANKDFADLILNGNEYEVLDEIPAMYLIKNEKGKLLKYPRAIFKEINVSKVQTFGEDVIEI